MAEAATEMTEDNPINDQLDIMDAGVTLMVIILNACCCLEP